MIDVGSGAGFPGMILAMCGFEQVRLCEANERKCIFLEEVARETSTSVAIVNQRIEVIDGKFDIILSRAFAELNKLLEILEKNSRNESSYGLFHKGKTWKDEIKVSRKSWNYTTRIYKSITSKEGVIMSIHDLRRK
jgi:16S rRNA (guanine527-N7)-methyltransferase